MVVARKVYLLALLVLVPLAVSAQQTTSTEQTLLEKDVAELKERMTDLVSQRAATTLPAAIKSMSIHEIFIDAVGNVLAHVAVTLNNKSVVQLVATATISFPAAGGIQINPVATANVNAFQLLPVSGALCKNGLLRLATYDYNGQSRGFTAACHKEPDRAAFFSANKQHTQLHQIH